MANNTNQQSNPILDRIAALPPPLKDALFSDVTADTMFEIGKRHGLLIDKFGAMAHETGMVMLGEARPDDFAEHLAARLEIDRKKAEAIVQDINREIFAPVREHIRGAFGKPPAASSQKDGLRVPPPGGGDGTKKEHAPQEKAERAESSAVPAATLEDLEAELKHALNEERGEQPLSVVEKEPGKNMPGTNAPAEGFRRSGYSGGDPYREPIGEDMPNIASRPYVPGARSEVTPAGEPARGSMPPASRAALSNGKPAESEAEPKKDSVLPSSAPAPAQAQQPLTGEDQPRRPPAFPPQAGSDVFQAAGGAKKEDGQTGRPARGENTKNGILPAFRGINLSDMPKEDNKDAGEKKE